MTDDLIAAIRSQLKDRIANPFSGAFAVSWLAWNYRFVMVLISFEPISQKFEYVDENFFTSYFSFTDPNSLLIRGIIGPAITALAYLFLYPYPSREIFKVVHKHKLKLRELRQSIENEKLLSVGESRAMLKKIAVLEDEYNQETVGLRSQITQLNEALVQAEKDGSRELLKERDRLETSIGDLEERLTERSGKGDEKNEQDRKAAIDSKIESSKLINEKEKPLLSALLAIGNDPYSRASDLLGVTAHKNLVRLEIDLKELEDLGLVNSTPNGFTITDDGRNTLVQKGMV